MNSDGVDYGALIWSDDLMLGIDVIDAQHREWIALVHAYQQAVQKGGTAEEVQSALAAAVAYTESHFADEQRVMEEAGYPFLDDHVEQHGLAWERVHAFAVNPTGDDALREDLADFLPQWLMLHINTADRQFARWLKSTTDAPCAPASLEGRVFGDIPL